MCIRDRIAAGAVLIIALTLLEGSFDYNGSGILLIERCFEGEVQYTAFLWKILFTAVTLEAGFKGGEIVPTFCIGAVFGCSFAMATGQPFGLMTACGMLALFVGVTNCPISTLLIGFEMFGYCLLYTSWIFTPGFQKGSCFITMSRMQESLLRKALKSSSGP